MRPRLILVVEDESSVRELIANIQLRDDHEVDTASDGVDALYRIEQRGYDLIISDLQMPNLDGPGLYEALRKRFGQDLPRVIIPAGPPPAMQQPTLPAPLSTAQCYNARAPASGTLEGISAR